MKRTACILLCILLQIAGRPFAAPATERHDNSLAKDFVMDAPWRVLDADTAIPISIILKDCDEDDIRALHWIRCWDVTSGSTLLWDHGYGDETIGDDATEETYWAWITTVTEGHSSLPDGTPLTPANLGYGAGQAIDLKVSIYFRDNIFNYTETRRLRVRVGGGAWPWPADWYGGDTHYHSMFTNNIAEFGAPLPAVALAARAMGLHWLTVTDHSCDLDETGDGTWSYATQAWEYTLQTPEGISTFTRDAQEGGSSWSGLGAEVARLDGPAFRLYRGVELNMASIDGDTFDKTLHCLVYNPDYIHSPYCGALGERPVFPSLPDALDALAPAGFAYAAHPMNDLGGEGGIDITVNGARWGDEDYAAALLREGFRGVQAFNTRHALTSSDQNDPWSDFDAGNAYTGDDAYPDELNAGIARWEDLLRAGLAEAPPRTVYLAGGSDAHGDLNYATYLSLGTYATDNAIGKVQTVVHVPGGHGPGDLPPMSDLLAAYRAGRSVATDGPFLEIGLDRDDDGDWYEAGDLALGERGDAPAGAPLPLAIRWASLPEFGEVASVRILAGDAAQTTELLGFDPRQTGEGYGGGTVLELSGFGFTGWRWLRAECLTEDGAVGHRAYANPIWLDFADGTAVASSETPAAAAPRLGNHPNPFNPSTTVTFTLPEPASIRLEVLNTAGARIALLAEGFRDAGEHRLVWRGRDDRGRPTAAGVYLCRLDADGVTAVAKMLLLK